MGNIEMGYRRRILDSELDELIGALPALAIEGAKGVGKTASASRRAATAHALDDPERLMLAEADPKRLLDAKPPILIDEWQRLPEVWDLVRRAVDDGAAAGSFLLTGSASPDGAGRHSGAGRIPTIRMRPLSLAERTEEPTSVSMAELLEWRERLSRGGTSLGLTDYTNAIVASGFPGLRGIASERALRVPLDGYLDRIVDRDFIELGHETRNPAALRRWMAAYAAASSTTTSFEKIRDAATGGEGEKLSKAAARPYRNALLSGFGSSTPCRLGSPPDGVSPDSPPHRSTNSPIRLWRRVCSARQPRRSSRTKSSGRRFSETARFSEPCSSHW